MADRNPPLSDNEARITSFHIENGIPNNEVKESDQAQERLGSCCACQMPLAADYRGLDPQRDKFREGTFAHAWFKTIADVYADHGINSAAVE